MGSRKILIQQVIIPDYRIGIFALLKKYYGDDLELFAGEVDFGGSPISSHKAWELSKNIRNYFLCFNNLLIQPEIIWPAIKADVVILNANVRIISNVAILIIRRILNKKSILWGHAYGRKLKRSIFKHIYFLLANQFISYTDEQKLYLKKNYPFLEISSAPNACMFENECFPSNPKNKKAYKILYIGRLILRKKVALLIKAFERARDGGLLPSNSSLVIVGDGDEKRRLEELKAINNYNDDIVFKGHINSLESLRELYADALCTVSPGYVGLSATQSFGFGIPMLIADNEPHSPEIEACSENFNSLFFKADSVSDLAKQLGKFYEQREPFLSRRNEISKNTKELYTFESMRDVFIKVIEN